MNNISLLVLAGGMGSRYKGSKQTDSISSENEKLMEFGLYDAIRSGIRKFVFIVNSNFPLDYKDHLIQILEKKNATVHFVVQTNQTFIPEKYRQNLQNREKPLGTGHAVYCAKEHIDGPFITINADDFYGRHSYESAVEIIQNQEISDGVFGLISFELKNTLSENGKVSRGICEAENGFLKKVEEFTSIQKQSDVIQGKNENGEIKNLNETDRVSMNFWILNPSFFQLAETGLNEFLENLSNPEKSEFYLPGVIDHAIHQKQLKVRILNTSEKWFGLTYREDKQSVVDEIRRMKSEGIYPESLWV